MWKISPVIILFFFQKKLKKHFFWPCLITCGIFVPQPEIEPELPAVETQSLNHWTSREVPILFCNC